MNFRCSKFPWFQGLFRIIAITGIMLMAQMPATSQPVLDHQFTYSTTITQLEKSGDKFFAMDNINNRCLLYNLDYSTFKTISLVLPQDYYLYNILQVSEHTFNSDDLVEIAYIYSKYTQIESSYYYSYETRVINENGVEILKIPGAGHTEIIQTESQDRLLRRNM